MHCQRFCFVLVAAICVAMTFSSTERSARAQQPETVSITFALELPFSPFYDDPTARLSDFVGEDTVVIIVRDLYQVADNLHFDTDSPLCDGVDVAGTSWEVHARGTIVNKGGPIGATVRCRSIPRPPEHSALVARKITQVHACWLKMQTDGDFIAQEDWNGYTSRVFIIVTGEFQVKN